MPLFYKDSSLQHEVRVLCLSFDACESNAIPDHAGAIELSVVAVSADEFTLHGVATAHDIWQCDVLAKLALLVTSSRLGIIVVGGSLKQRANVPVNLASSWTPWS